MTKPVRELSKSDLFAAEWQGNVDLADPRVNPDRRICLVCGRQGFDSYWEILLHCRSCGFITANLDATLDVSSLYEGDYFTGEEYLDYASDEVFFRRNFRRRLQAILGYRQSGRLLEIGSAYGFFLDMARSHFEVVGFEPNQEAARFGREKFQVEIRTDDFLKASADSIDGAVDVAVMWDVIEHLERPDHFIEHIADLSRPDALLAITTGDAGSRLARLRGQKWRMVHPPTHIHYFDRSTLTRLLERFGYEIIEIKPIGVARSVHQILYSILSLRLNMPTFYDLLKKTIPASAGFTLNTFDIMQVFARRK